MPQMETYGGGMMEGGLKADMVNHPPHYTDGREYEPVDVIRDWKLDYLLGNVVKYISRAGRKGDELEDLLKARWYLNRRIEEIQSEAISDEPPKDVTVECTNDYFCRRFVYTFIF